VKGQFPLFEAMVFVVIDYSGSRKLIQAYPERSSIKYLLFYTDNFEIIHYIARDNQVSSCVDIWKPWNTQKNACKYLLSLSVKCVLHHCPGLFIVRTSFVAIFPFTL
jgi:hypothetical protein